MAVMAAIVASASMLAAGPAFVMMFSVMVAVDNGVKGQVSGQIGSPPLARVAGTPALELDPGSRQGCLGAAADAAAQEHLHLGVGQKSGQRAVSLAIGVHHLGGHHLAVPDVVELELPAMAEMLENLSVFISYRNLHVATSSVSVFMAQRLPQPRPQRAQ